MKIKHVQFPMFLPPPGLKRTLRLTMGRILLALQPGLRQKIEKGQIPDYLSVWDKCSIGAVVAAHSQAGTLDKLNHLHQWAWKKDQAVEFHSQASTFFKQYWLEHHSAIEPEIRKEIDRIPGQYSTLCEIGCGTGLVLQHLGNHLTELKRFVGLDLSPAQIKLNQENFRGLDKYAFAAADAAEWIPQQAQPGWIYFTNAGVLEYFPRATLAKLFAAVMATKQPAAFAIIEPIGSYDLDRETESRPHGHEHSLAHNYRLLFKDAGFTIRFETTQEFDGQRWILLIASTN